MTIKGFFEGQGVAPDAKRLVLDEESMIELRIDVVSSCEITKAARGAEILQLMRSTPVEGLFYQGKFCGVDVYMDPAAPPGTAKWE